MSKQLVCVTQCGETYCVWVPTEWQGKTLRMRMKNARFWWWFDTAIVRQEVASA